MWTLASVTTESANSYTVFGGLPGKEILGPADPLGPVKAAYIIAFPGLGYIKLVDMGNTHDGADWSVSASGASNYWYYRGEGAARIHVRANGQFTITGGTRDTTGRVVPWN